MHTEFRRAVLPRELRSLVIFDHKAFHHHPADWFDRTTWLTLDSWWMILDGAKAGCCAFQPHADFPGDLRETHQSPHLPGSLYIVSTGILPRFQGHGFGALLKSWQVSYGRRHGFTRLVTNTRRSNARMITLNKKFGFRILRTTPDYYSDPAEPAVVMERRL